MQQLLGTPVLDLLILKEKLYIRYYYFRLVLFKHDISFSVPATGLISSSILLIAPHLFYIISFLMHVRRIY